MISQSGYNLAELRVDGGGSKNAFLMQFQSDILSVPIAVSGTENTSAVGAAIMAGLGMGFWKSFDEIKGLGAPVKPYNPKMKKRVSEKLYLGWKNSIDRILTAKAN